MTIFTVYAFLLGMFLGCARSRVAVLLPVFTVIMLSAISVAWDFTQAVQFVFAGLIAVQLGYSLGWATMSMSLWSRPAS